MIIIVQQFFAPDWCSAAATKICASDRKLCSCRAVHFGVSVFDGALENRMREIAAELAMLGFVLQPNLRFC